MKAIFCLVKTYFQTNFPLRMVEKDFLSCGNRFLLFNLFFYKKKRSLKLVEIHFLGEKTLFLLVERDFLSSGNCFLLRIIHLRCSITKGVLKTFAKFTGKHLCQSLFFNKVASLKLFLFLSCLGITLHLKLLWLYLPQKYKINLNHKLINFLTMFTIIYWVSYGNKDPLLRILTTVEKIHCKTPFVEQSIS